MKNIYHISEMNWTAHRSAPKMMAASQFILMTLLESAKWGNSRTESISKRDLGLRSRSSRSTYLLKVSVIMAIFIRAVKIVSLIRQNGLKNSFNITEIG